MSNSYNFQIFTYLIILLIVINRIQTCGMPNPTSENDCWNSSTDTSGCCYLTDYNALTNTDNLNAKPMCGSYLYTSYPKVMDKVGGTVYKVSCPLTNNPFFNFLPCRLNSTASTYSLTTKCDLYNQPMNYCCIAWSIKYDNYACLYSNNTLVGNFTTNNGVNYICTNSLNITTFILMSVVMFLFVII